MAQIPIILKLKKEKYKELAEAQDVIIEELYKVFDRAVLHGGTAIWRCYSGNRFSEDVDVYIEKSISKLDTLFSNFEKRGFSIEKKKINENSIYSTLRISGTFVRFEALFKKESGSLKEYEKIDGNFITVYTLTPEEIIKEKVETYLKRKKIRDLYDIFFLLRHVKENKKVGLELKKLINNFQNPIDKENLKVLIFDGIAPDAGKIMDYIKRFI